MQKVDSETAGDVTLVGKADGSTAVIGTTQHAYVASVSEIDSSGAAFAPSREVKTQYGQDVKLTSSSRGAYAGQLYGGSVQAAGGTQHSIYILQRMSASDDSYVFIDIFGGMNDVFDGDIIDICYRESDKRIAAATEKSIYMCKFDGSYADASTLVRLCGMNGVALPGKVRNVQLIEDSSTEYTDYIDTLLVFTSLGKILVSVKPEDGECTLADESWHTLLDDDVRVNDILRRDNMAYYATSSGLCRLGSDGKLHHLGFDGLSSEVKHLTLHKGHIWCGDADGHVLCCNHAGNIEVYRSLGHGIANVQFCNDIMVIASLSSLVYDDRSDVNPGLKSIKYQNADISCIDAVMGHDGSDLSIYAVGNASPGDFALLSVNVPDMQYTETSAILGLSSVIGSSLSVHATAATFTLGGTRETSYAVVNYGEQLSDI